MDTELRGLAILYGANVAWALLFGLCGFAMAVVFRVPGVIVTFFRGPRLFRATLAHAILELRLFPFPSSSIASVFRDDPAVVEPEFWEDSHGEDHSPWADDLDEDDEGRVALEDRRAEEEFWTQEVPMDLPPAPPWDTPFGTLPLRARLLVLLGPYALLSLLVLLLSGPGTLARVPADAVALVRGALAPTSTGADLARGFLQRLGETPSLTAVGLARGKQLAFVLLPIWPGLWSTLLFVFQPDPARARAWQKIAVIGSLAGLSVLGAWAVAIGFAILRT